MPTIPLPERPSAVQLRKLARELQRRIRSGSRELLDEFYPGYEGDTRSLPLSIAQLVLARSFGFAGWPRLVQYVELVRDYTRVPDSDHGISDPSDRFLAHAVLRYGDTDGPARWAIAERMREESPELARSTIWAAAAASDHQAVEQLLTQDSGAASRPGGPFDWEPLLYLTYSRLVASLTDTLITARLLLAAGADPNAGYLWHGYPTPFTALAGVFGSGEQGPIKQPPHPHQLALAKLLLAAGAEANDVQVLYNRMFEPNNDHLRLLFDHGLGSGDGGRWRRLMPEVADSPTRLLSIQLGWAVGHGMQERVALLAEHGVDLDAAVDSPYVAPMTPLELAGRTGQREVYDLLIALGANPATLSAESVLVSALMFADRGVVEQHADLLGTARQSHRSLVLRAVAADRLDAVEFLVEQGFDVNAFGRSDVGSDEPWETALHHAAFEGRLAGAQLLLRLGADATLRDKRFGGTPLNWAQRGGHVELIELLKPLTP